MTVRSIAIRVFVDDKSEARAIRDKLGSAVELDFHAGRRTLEDATDQGVARSIAMTRRRRAVPKES